MELRRSTAATVQKALKKVGGMRISLENTESTLLSISLINVKYSRLPCSKKNNAMK
jgi:hypothetical protein